MMVKSPVQMTPCLQIEELCSVSGNRSHHFDFPFKNGIVRCRPIVFNWLNKPFDSSVHSSNELFPMLLIPIPCCNTRYKPHVIAKNSKSHASKCRQKGWCVLCTVLYLGYSESFETESVSCFTRGSKCLFPKRKHRSSLKAGHRCLSQFARNFDKVWHSEMLISCYFPLKIGVFLTT